MYAIKLTKHALRLGRDAYRYIAFRHSHFRGVYETFEQAEAAAPARKKIGYNHKELAQTYRAELDFHLSSFDKPVLFHLDRILRDGTTVLDFGGNIGTHYLSYKNHLNLKKVKWIVCDLPEITIAGRQACAGISNISFVNDVAEVKEPRVDIFLASGSVQYVASHDLLLQQLIDSNIRPRHILINRLPLYDGQRFITLQNGGLVYCPQYVFNRLEYIRSIAKLGYELIDFWDDNVDTCIIPFHPEKTIHAYKGLYFCERT